MNISAIVSLINAFAATRKYLQCLLLSKKCISSTISLTPDAFSAFPYLLRSCVGISLIDPAKSLHGYLIKCGYLSWVGINTSLIQVYLEFNDIVVARQLFDEMPVRNSQYFDSLISRFGSCGLFKDVLNIFEEMVGFGYTPCYGSVCKAIAACGELRRLEKGRWVNDYVVQCGLNRNTVICNMLISMYIKMGRLDLAHCVFDGMEKKDVVSWNSLITRYAQNGDWVVALNLFHTMKKECNLVHDNVTFLGVVVACTHGGNLDLGQSIHGRCIRAGLFSDFRLGNTILDLYAKCGKIEYAELLFEDEVFEKSLVSWNSLILGYVKSCCYYKAVNCFKRLCTHSIMNPDAVTLANVIPAYSSLRSSDSIRSIHALIKKKGIDMITDVVLGTALIDAYGKCYDIVGAEHLFNDIKLADTPIWNVMLTSYYLNNRADKGMLLFVQMVCSQIPVDSITAIALLQMSGKLGSLKIGKMGHAYCLIKGFYTHLKVENALLDMYMRCKSVENSEKLFQLMNVKNTVTWNIMFTGYVKFDSCSKVLTLFSQMLLDRVHRPDSVTLISLIHASAVVLTPHGADVAYAFVSKLGFDSDTAVMNSLMDAYAKNGFIHKARSLFVQMGETRDQWSWNVMIAGFGINGQEEKACELLTQMSQDGHEPDSITFKSLLFACAHSGMIDKGCYYINLMVNKYKIHPDLEHWTCFINMFGRAGRLDEAYQLIDSILADHLSSVNPSDSHAIWGAFVDACRMYDNIELGEVAGRKLLELSPQNTGYQIMLSNLYASNMRWDDAMKARQVFNDGSLVKEAAHSAVKM
ncbi:pentatricopeptide repeat-containing protein At4g21300-like [Silene latifolia]|uniref:pentatricopeptide repeat-containing protein At4g21300-like n=1 Tax=Silene latifolia TaxID=37657 RepID=UPI003D770F3E